MAGDMWDNIMAQKPVLKSILEDKAGIVQRSVGNIDLNKTSRIIFTGSGTSFNAGIAVRHMYESLLKKEIFVEYPYMLRNYSGLLNEVESKAALMIAVSQSGRSTGTLECVKKARIMGIETAAVTADKDSPLAAASDHVIEVMCGEEQAGPKTKGYTSTMLTLQLMALCLGKKAGFIGEKEYCNYLEQIWRMIENIDDVIQKSRQWIDKNMEWKNAKSICVIGYGPGYGTALEGSLKILETFRKPVLAYDVEEYIHGPYNTLDENSFMIFIDAKPGGSPELNKLMDFAKNITKNFLVIAAGDGNAADITQEHIIPIPPCDELVSPLISIVPFQVIAYRLAKSRGIEPETPRYPEFHKIMGSK
ncbi:MAG TPA: SIS domain-containing protein [Thermoanaerobacterales bacterium]|nr:SIS domain-containing protein [Thermoanaerobacterales bacterium]